MPPPPRIPYRPRIPPRALSSRYDRFDDTLRLDAIDEYVRKPYLSEESVSILDNVTDQRNNSFPGKPDEPKQVKQNHYSFTDSSLYPSRYYLELYEDPSQPPIDTILCPLVNTIQMSQPLAVTRTWTFEGSPYEEHSGFQQRTFVINGRSGYSFTALSRFAKFRNFMEKYAKLSADNKNAFIRRKDIRLALNFPWEGEAYWCTLISFQYQRNISTSRVSYEYQLTLVTNGVASQRWDPDGALGYVNCDKGDGCHLDSRHFCKSRAIQEIKRLSPPDVKDVIGADDPVLDKLIENTEPSVVEGASGSGVTGASPGYYQVLWQEANDCFNAIYFRYSTLPMSQKAAARISVNIVCRWLVDLRIQCEIELGSRGIRVDTEPSQPASQDTLRPRPVANQGEVVGVVTVSSGEESAHDISQRYLGDRNLWLQIVNLNNMIDTRTKKDGSLLRAGDPVFVPIASGIPNIGELYGTGFLIKDGDLVAEGDEDIVLVSGFANFYQNLRHRLLTVRGENKAFPGFGLPKLVGTSDTTDVPSQVLSNVRLQVLADHRVQGLVELDLEEEADKITVDFTVETITRDKVRQNFDYKLQ